MNCNHEWLVPSNNRTICKLCGRDGFIALDTEHTQNGYKHTQNRNKESTPKVSERNDLGPNKTIPKDDFDRLALEIAYDETKALLDRALKWMRNQGTLDSDWTKAVERHLGVTLTTDSESPDRLKLFEESIRHSFKEREDKHLERIQDLERELARWKKTQPQNMEDYDELCIKLSIAVDALKYVVHYYSGNTIANTDPSAEQKCKDALEKIGVMK